MHPEAITSGAKKLVEQLAKLDKYYLAGGTGLALQIGHRISVDFDFFTKKNIGNTTNQLEKLFKLEFKILVNQPKQLTVELNSVQVSFIKYPFTVYSKSNMWKGIKIITPEIIGAMKAYTLGRRATFKDYVDLYFILKLDIATLSNIVKLSNKIFGSAFNDRLFLEQLVYLEDVSEEKINFLKTPVSKKEIEDYFDNRIKNYELP